MTSKKKARVVKTNQIKSQQALRAMLVRLLIWTHIYSLETQCKVKQSSTRKNKNENYHNKFLSNKKHKINLNYQRKATKHLGDRLSMMSSQISLKYKIHNWTMNLSSLLRMSRYLKGFKKICLTKGMRSKIKTYKSKNRSKKNKNKRMLNSQGSLKTYPIPISD